MPWRNNFPKSTDMMELKESPEQQTEQERPPSEFTLRGNFVIFGSALAYFVTVGFVNSFGVLQEYYQSDILRNESPFRISWIGSFNAFSIFIFAGPAGILADKIGPIIPMAIGAVLLPLALFMVSLCKKYWHFFLAQGLLMGLGMSFLAIPATGAVPKFFKRNRAVATGISVAGSSLGGVIWPIVMDQLFLKTSLGFGWSIRIVGFIMIPLVVIAVFTAGLPQKASNEGDQAKEAGSVVDKSFLKQPPFLLLCAGLTLSSLGFFTPFFYASSYGITKGMSQNTSFYTLTAVNAGSAFGRILPGFVADRWGKFNILAGSALTATIVVFCWTAATSTAGVFVWVTIYGFASGGILSLEVAAATALAPDEMATTALGICLGSSALAQLFGPPISGQILNHGYKAVSIWCGVTLLAGFLSLLGARLALDRRILARI